MLSDAVTAFAEPNLAEYGIRHPGQVHRDMPARALVERALGRAAAGNFAFSCRRNASQDGLYS